MELNWREIDRWIFGEAWTGSQIRDHVEMLCEQIGPRWASSEGERQAWSTYGNSLPRRAWPMRRWRSLR